MKSFLKQLRSWISPRYTSRRSKGLTANYTRIGSAERLDDRVLPAGVVGGGIVTVSLVAGNLTFTGDESSNRFAIEFNEEDQQVAMFGFDRTRFRYQGGVSSEIQIPVASILGDVKFDLRGGDDILQVYSPTELNLPKGFLAELGDGDDRIRVDVDELSVVGNVVINSGEGADELFFSALSSLVINGNLTITTGDDADNVGIEAPGGDLTIKGEVSLSTGDGADFVEFNADYADFQKSVILTTGAGEDQIAFGQFDGSELEAMNDHELDRFYDNFGFGSPEVSAMSFDVGKDLKIDTGAQRDFVVIRPGDCQIGGLVSLVTGSGNDRVLYNAADDAIIGLDLIVNTGVGSDRVDFTTRYFELRGSASFLTGNGDDTVSWIFNSLAVINKDLKVDTGNNSDAVRLMTDDADLTVKGSVNVGLGNDDDFLFAGYARGFDDDLGSPNARFFVGLDVVVTGGTGDDVIELYEFNRIGREVKVNSGAGDDLVSLSGSYIVGNLTVTTDIGNDLVALVDSLRLDGTTNVDTGAGDDAVFVEDCSVLNTFLLKFGAGNDNFVFDITPEDFVTGKKMLVDGGAGIDKFDSDHTILPGIATFTNFDSDPNDDNSHEIDTAPFVELYQELQSTFRFSFDNPE